MDLGKGDMDLIQLEGISKDAKQVLKQIRFLNRVVSWVDATRDSPDQILWEADSRHAEVLCSQLGLCAASNAFVRTQTAPEVFAGCFSHAPSKE